MLATYAGNKEAAEKFVEENAEFKENIHIAGFMSQATKNQKNSLKRCLLKTDAQ